MIEGIQLKGLNASYGPIDHNERNGKNGRRGVAQPG